VKPWLAKSSNSLNLIIYVPMCSTCLPMYLRAFVHENCYAMTFGGDYSRLYAFFPSFLALVHKNPSYIQCTRYSCNILLIYEKNHRWPQKQINHSFRCFTKHCCPQDEQIFRSYGSCVFQPCMRTGWMVEMSPSNHYWWRYEVGQFLGGLGIGGHWTRNKLGGS
jgi:hypothetical protein